MTDAVTELLLRYELGDFDPRVRSRLAEIFRTNPPDALELLQRAADYLGLQEVTEETLARVDALPSPASRSRTPTSEKVSTVKTKRDRTL